MRAIIGPIVIFALLPLASLGCRADRGDWITEPLEVLGPVALGHQLYYVERNRGELLAVDVLAGSPGGHVTRLALGKDPGPPQVVPGGPDLPAPRGLAVLVPREHELHLVTEDDDGELTQRTLPLEWAYNQLGFSADGAWGVAWIGGAEEQIEYMTSVGRVAVFDVEKAVEGEEGAVSERSLYLEDAPDSVVFSRPLRLLPGEEPATLAAVVSPTRIAVVDLAEGARRSRTIFLDPGVRPRNMRFSDGLAPEATAEYLLFDAHGEAGISAYRITGTDPASEKEPRLRIAYHQLMPDDPPADYEVFAAPGGERYMLVSVGAHARRATVMESLTTPVGTPVDLPKGPVNRVLRSPIPGQDAVAVLYDDGGQGRALQILTLPANPGEHPRVVATEDFVGEVHWVHTVPGQPGKALVFPYDSTQVELVNLESARATPVRFRSRPLDMGWDRPGSNLWLAVSDPTLEEGELLVRGRVEDESLISTPLELDHPPETVHLLEARGLAVVTHAAAAGLITVVPISEMERGNARVLEGFLFTGLLDAVAGRTP